MAVHAKTKFLIGAALLVSTVGYLMATGIKDTGTYFLTPSELATRIKADHSFYSVGVKVGAKVVKGTIHRDVASQTIAFQMSDGVQVYPVVYRGLAPDTFTDEVDIVVEGRLGQDGTFRATSLLAKCGSKYEAVPAA
jgi:cytochrome c-type biogenesis protein CcmE